MRVNVKFSWGFSFHLVFLPHLTIFLQSLIFEVISLFKRQKKAEFLLVLFHFSKLFLNNQTLDSTYYVVRREYALHWLASQCSSTVVAEPNQPLVDSCALYVGQMNAISPTSITPCSSLTLLLPLAFTCQTCIILLLVRTRVRICRSQ